MRFAANRVEPLIQHEVGTHVVTYWNGAAQRFKLLATGLAGYDELQEGLAVLAEYLVAGLTESRLRTLAARVLAARAVSDGSEFIDTFRLLTAEYGMAPRPAFQIATRVHRGGGFVKDAVYLRGLQRVVEYLGDGGRLDTLLVGKISVNHAPVIEELQRRRVLVPPPLRPSYLDHPDTHYRLERLRATSDLVELAEPRGRFRPRDTSRTASVAAASASPTRARSPLSSASAGPLVHEDLLDLDGQRTTPAGVAFVDPAAHVAAPEPDVLPNVEVATVERELARSSTRERIDDVAPDRSVDAAGPDVDLRVLHSRVVDGRIGTAAPMVVGVEIENDEPSCAAATASHTVTEVSIEGVVDRERSFDDLVSEQRLRPQRASDQAARHRDRPQRPEADSDRLRIETCRRAIWLPATGQPPIGERILFAKAHLVVESDERHEPGAKLRGRRGSPWR